MKKPISLHWYNNKPNFGDALAADVVRVVSGRDVVWADPLTCDLFSTGSLYDFIQKRALSDQPGANVWGSGTLGPMKNPFWGGVRIHAQRGPLTRLTTLSACSTHGDPGLLYPMIYGESISKSEEAIFIPHRRHVEKALSMIGQNPRIGLRVVDPRTSDHQSIARAIVGSRLVFSSSLHGLIISDAFAVPNIWVMPKGIHRWPYWKFLDYFLSIRRPLTKPIFMHQILENLSNPVSFDKHLTARIEKRRTALLDAFPKCLKSPS